MKEDLLIDLDLPPVTGGATSNRPAHQNLSLLDEPIDVPEVGEFCYKKKNYKIQYTKFIR